MELLRVDPGLMIWTWITFGVVLFILVKFAWKPIISGLDARANKVRDDLAAAEKAKDDALKVLDEYKKKIEDGRSEARTIIEHARTEANRLREQMLADATAQLEDHRKKALVEIDKAKEESVLAVREEIISVSTMIAGKILEKEVSRDVNHALVDEFVKKMSN